MPFNFFLYFQQFNLSLEMGSGHALVGKNL